MSQSLPSSGVPAAQADPAEVRDPRGGPDGRTARVTLTSILLGAIVAAIVSALPPTPTTFVTTVLRGDHLLIDFRVLALLLTAFNMWLQYSWSVILRLVPFDFMSNLLSFLQAITMVGAALSVGDGRAWFAWLAAVFAMVAAAYVSMRGLRAIQVAWWRIALPGGGALVCAVLALAQYQVLPSAWAGGPPIVWVALITAAVIADLAAFARFLPPAPPPAR